MEIPAYPWWAADKPEAVFGAQPDRYLQIEKAEAYKIMEALPEETAMADMLFVKGHLGEEAFGMADRQYAVEATPEQVRDTTAALLRSFGPSHEVKIATIAVALYHWFPKEGQERGNPDEA